MTTEDMASLLERMAARIREYGPAEIEDWMEVEWHFAVRPIKTMLPALKRQCEKAKQ